MLKGIDFYIKIKTQYIQELLVSLHIVKKVNDTFINQNPSSNK